MKAKEEEDEEISIGSDTFFIVWLTVSVIKREFNTRK